uniref:Protein FAM161B n=1 Tax=Knipowitschia caucasica TaxID=637954 RepID=A0AAV2JEA6_KNICA
MSELEMLPQDHIESELVLRHHLKALRESLHQQLQEMERQQEQELAKRIQLNTALSTTHGCKEEAQRFAELGKVSSTPAENSNQRITSDQTNPTVVYSSWNSADKSSRFTRARTHCERAALATTGPSKEEEALAECVKKFSACPVPSHVSRPLFKDMMVKKERQRQQSLEQRKNFLLSMQQPFQFEEREKEKRVKLMAKINVASAIEDDGAGFLKTSHRSIKDYRKANRGCYKGPIQTVTSASEGPRLRTADRTRRERVGFLDESPSFQPKIIHQVPDFCRLHKALQKETTQTKETTRCQPFHLRTSALPVRQSKGSPQQSQVNDKADYTLAKAQKGPPLSRSRSLGALASLSTDTLPVHITDAVRRRAEAIRKSVELRESKSQESGEWLRRYQQRSQALQKTLTLQAKLLDPHRSLKEVYNEKLQQHRDAEQRRMRDYSTELQGMRARVRERPYLFQQLQQKSAKASAEKTYINTLRSAGLKEQFVEENGLARLSSSASISEANTDASCEDQLSREENGDAGEKIEDVREESVNNKGDEMP